MNNKTIHNLIIIGSGPAGLTAGIYGARADLKPLIIDGNNPGGQLINTTYVENWPGEKSILGPKLMQNMREHAEHFGAEFLSQLIVKVDFSQKPFTLWTDRDKELKAHAVIIASGASPNRLGCPGEDKYWGKGVTTCAVCDASFYRDKKVLVVGGGDTAMEDASFLKKFTNDITVVQNLDHLTASQAMKKRVLDDPDIDIIYNSTVTEFRGDDKVREVTITNTETNETQDMKIDGVFIAIGMTPNTKPYEGQIEMDKFGYIKVREQTKTSVEGVFSAGDVHDYRYKQAITAAGSGCKSLLDAERYLKNVL